MPDADENPFAEADEVSAPSSSPSTASIPTSPPSPRFPAEDDDPFSSAIGGGSGARITDYMEQLVLVKPLKVLRDVTTTIGVSDAMLVDFAVLDGDEAGSSFENAMVFPIALRNDLQRLLDERKMPYILGRMTKGTAKGTKSAPYLFGRPDEDDKKLAREFLADNRF